jgi:hypothetical protein
LLEGSGRFSEEKLRKRLFINLDRAGETALGSD